MQRFAAAASALGGGLASALPAHFTLGSHAWVNLIIEPGAHPVRSLGALLELVWPRARSAPAPVLAEARTGTREP